ncbi:hypothetical protein DPMN_006294 [Dreissena polymorpha]|uniref:Uncharacterized protein n=1 Tax=Dreissena polymorpha TaxID=45954 RepID=A0A9D4RV94_DREPO|nr:hypothetical protein DPMN_006294 [Dreissena polymorpha]
MNLRTKFHEDRTLNVASRTNLLTKFHEVWTINVASREKCPAPGGHVFKETKTKLIQDIIGTNLQAKFHDDRKINVTSRVLTRKICTKYVFSQIWTIFELVRDFKEPSVLTKFHDDWAKIVTSRVFTRNTASPPGGHVFQQTRTIFELNQHIIKTNILTNFKVSRGIMRKNVLTTFHENQTINVASRVFTRQNVDDARRTTDKRRSQKLTMSTMCSDSKELTCSNKMFLPTFMTSEHPGSHVFLHTKTVCIHIQDII